MDLHRISAKLFIADASAISRAAGEYIPIFHRWIQGGELSGLPLDVADYGHVIDGPGVMLIGHEADRSLDLADGRPGFVYARKREAAGSVRERLAQVIGEAVEGARRLENEPALEGAVSFRTDELQISVKDRLNAPNTQATFDALSQDIGAAISDVLPGAAATLAQLGDDRRPFTVQVTVSGVAQLAAA
jgi:hypothetical protein